MHELLCFVIKQSKKLWISISGTASSAFSIGSFSDSGQQGTNSRIPWFVVLDIGKTPVAWEKTFFFAFCDFPFVLGNFFNGFSSISEQHWFHSDVFWSCSFGVFLKITLLNQANNYNFKNLEGFDSHMLNQKCLIIQWSLRWKTTPSVVIGWSLRGVRSDIGVQNVLKILFGADKGAVT